MTETGSPILQNSLLSGEHTYKEQQPGIVDVRDAVVAPESGSLHGRGEPEEDLEG